MEDKFNDMHFITIILKKVFNYIKMLIIVCLYLTLSTSVSVSRMTSRFLINLSPQFHVLGNFLFVSSFFMSLLCYVT